MPAITVQVKSVSCGLIYEQNQREICTVDYQFNNISPQRVFIWTVIWTHTMCRVGYFIQVQMMDCVFIGTTAATLRASPQWNIDFFFFFFLLPSISLSLLHTICIPLSPSHTYTLIQHRQVGLICCIGQCQSSTLSCGNRGLMISILRLGRLCYIYFSCCALRVCGRSLPPAFYGFLTTSSDCYGDNSETGVILPHPEAFFN